MTARVIATTARVVTCFFLFIMCIILFLGDKIRMIIRPKRFYHMKGKNNTNDVYVQFYNSFMHEKLSTSFVKRVIH